MRNLKALGLALMSVFVFGALAASAAQATNGKFTSANGLYPVAITGHEEPPTGTNYFEVTGPNGPKTHCENVTYEGTITEPSSKVTVTPHYTNCVSTQGETSPSTVVDLNGCHYVFETGTNTSATDTHGSVEVVCPAGQKIEVIVAGLCVVDIPPQTITGGITYTNIANGDVTVDVSISEKITYTETDRSFLCPNTNNHHTGNGSFFAEVIVTGFEDKGSHSGETIGPDGTPWPYQTVTEGPARDIHVK